MVQGPLVLVGKADQRRAAMAVNDEAGVRDPGGANTYGE
jgi:hypothetical protein